MGCIKSNRLSQEKKMRLRHAISLVCSAVLISQAAQAAPFTGASGMAYVPEANQYLCVQDVKTPDASGRFGFLSTGFPSSDPYVDLPVDWHDTLPASDLEALCPVPGTSSEFLACESGYWMGKFGRLFHIRLLQNGSPELVARSGYAQSNPPQAPAPPPDVWTVEVLRTIQLPILSGQIEGIACVRKGDGGLLLLLGERGGDTAYSSASILWGELDLAAGSFNLTPNGQIGVEVSWPLRSSWPWDRAISDLYIDPSGYLWISGADDAADFGPFRSYIQVAGRINPDVDYPVDMYMPQVRNWALDGVKVEAIAAPSTPGSVLCYATDDELYGGIWRPLPPAAPADFSYYGSEY